MQIVHSTKEFLQPCQRKWRITIPDEYVTEGRRPNRVFFLGRVNLETELDGEETDCVH